MGIRTYRKFRKANDCGVGTGGWSWLSVLFSNCRGHQKKQKVAAANYIFDSEDREALADALDPHWKGPVPYTLLIAPGGKVIYRKHNSIDPLELKRAIVKELGRTYK